MPRFDDLDIAFGNGDRFCIPAGLIKPVRLRQEIGGLLGSKTLAHACSVERRLQTGSSRSRGRLSRYSPFVSRLCAYRRARSPLSALQKIGAKRALAP